MPDQSSSASRRVVAALLFATRWAFAMAFVSRTSDFGGSSSSGAGDVTAIFVYSKSGFKFGGQKGIRFSLQQAVTNSISRRVAVAFCSGTRRLSSAASSANRRVSAAAGAALQLVQQDSNGSVTFAASDGSGDRINDTVIISSGRKNSHTFAHKLWKQQRLHVYHEQWQQPCR